MILSHRLCRFGVNDFLKKIEDDGTWTELWQICIGDRTGDTNVPELPEIGA